jgi:hypothetical protein
VATQEIAKRFTPTSDTLRELFLKSGNLCSFPGCGHLMMNLDGKFVGQICHIEAAEKGGERFNQNMTNEQRRNAANLMLMCYEHHQVTNDVTKYTVELLRQFKEDHERKFSRADRAMLEQLTDWTTVDEPSKVRNLKRLNKVMGWQNSDVEDAEVVADLNAYIEKLRVVPIEVRRFLGAVATRAHRMQATQAVEINRFAGSTSILLKDLKDALRLSPNVIFEQASALESYGIGSMTEMYVADLDQHAVRIYPTKHNWNLWLDLVTFCQKAPEPLSAFTDDLDFSRLDER